jgi:lipopolysaccharide/colanic/teichoic acid biosynthesis glycosyltransferase
MSLVGPRPLLVRYYAFFTPAERVRFLVRPGITGLSQVHGRNDLSWDLRIARDVHYVSRCSLGLDLRILLLTVWRVVSRDGLRVDPGATMLDFDEERQRAQPRLEGGTP